MMERRNPNIRPLNTMCNGTTFKRDRDTYVVIRQMPDVGKTLVASVSSVKKNYDVLDNSISYRDIHCVMNLNTMFNWNESVEFEEQWRKDNNKLEGWKKPDIDWPRNCLEQKFGRTKDEFISPQEFLKMEKEKRRKQYDELKKEFEQE